MRAAALATLVALAGCDTIADGSRFEQTIQETAAAKGIALTVDCPDEIPLGKVEDNHFRCDVMVTGTGERGVLEVALDAAGNLRWDVVE